MNFDFSEEDRLIQDQTARLLGDQCGPDTVRSVLDGDANYARSVWESLCQMGLPGTAIDEALGGAGAGHLPLCLVAQELGAHVAPVPFSSSVYLATEAISRFGSPSQQSALLPDFASGQRIGTFAACETGDPREPRSMHCRVQDSKLTGAKTAVADGSIADTAIVATRDGLFIADLGDSSVQRTTVASIDPTRDTAELVFDGTAVEPLGSVDANDASDALKSLYDRAAVLFAFEQLGGAQAALDMAVGYARERYAFGRPIGSFQALKHMMADMYVALKLAESNCFYAAWALATDAPELPLAAATARVSATQAYQLCSRDNIQVHGGMGFTWEFDCHLYYRRSNYLALQLGGLTEWEDKLVAALPAVAA